MKTYIPDQLYQSSRPGYPSIHPAQQAVKSWFEDAKDIGSQTIICLLTNEQLNIYNHLSEGLLETYENEGFQVVHQPITDPADDPRGWEKLANKLSAIYQDYLAAHKPVLIHCSAGIDRSPKAAQFIVDSIGGKVDLIQ
ncbi:MAG: protein-tyrosine phosphatase family protein [Anaerolineaceae bacterium]